MKYVMLGLVALVMGVGLVAVTHAQFTDTAATDNYGKIGLKKLTADIDTNFALIETGGFQIKSWGYPAVVGHTNGSAQVYMTQSGSVVGDGGTTATQTFTVAFIATPNVVITSSSAASATNAPYIGTIASNQFTVVTDGVGTNFQWIAHGRIK